MTKTPVPALDEIEVRIYKKTLVRIIPIVMLGMFISYIDRANLGVLAKPMSEDLGLTAATFGLAAGFFYIGFCFVEIPSNMALAKVGARIWIARIMVTWGIATMLMAFVQNDVTLYIVRILLGTAEAGYSPGIMLFLAFWCPPRLLPKAYSMLNVSVPFALAFGAVITSGLLQLDGLLGYAGWRWAFFIEGIPAIALGVYIFLRLPNGPAEVSWLNTDEKAYLAKAGTQARERAAHDLGHLRTLFRRPSAWLFTGLFFCMAIGYWTIAYFLPTIIAEDFDLSPAGAGVVSAIPWMFAALVMILIGKSVTRTGERAWHLTILQIVSALGLVVGALADNPYLALAGISFAAAGYFGSLSTFQSMQAQVFAGALAAMALAMVNGLAALSGLVGPYLFGFLKDTTGSKESGLLIMAGFFIAAAVLMFFMSRWADKETGGLIPSSEVRPPVTTALSLATG